jgi:hypothetical protein
MSEAIIPSDKLTRDMVKTAFEAAYMQCSVDKDGDIVVEEGRRFYVIISPDKETVRFVAFARGNSNRSSQQRLTFANKINRRIAALRAHEDGDGDILFDYTILTNGGVTIRQIVMCAKRFATLINVAVGEDSDDVLA